MSGTIDLEGIIKAHASMVRRIATTYERYPDRIEDLVQTIWLAVWQALPRLHNQSAVKSYVARIAQNVCVTHVRRAVIRPSEPLEVSLADPAPPLDEVMAHARRLADLVAAVRALPESLKSVANLYLEGIPIKDIALTLGISESNASVRLHRAKSAIRTSFGDIA